MIRIVVFLLVLCPPLVAAAETANPGKPPVAATDGVVGDLGEIAVGLTKEECRGLGGRVLNSVAGNPENCSGKYCSTTDKHGVIRMACIDEKSK